MPRHVTGPGVALAAVLLLVGCGASDDGGAPEPDDDARSSTPVGTHVPSAFPGGERCPRLGVYSDWSPDADRQVVRQFGVLPEVATSYYQPTDRIRVPEETARIRRGTSPNITITTKGTEIIEVLAAGPGDSRYPEVEAWLDGHLDDLASLADVDPSVPVYATLEHEFRAKARSGLVTGRSADPEVYGLALSRFYELADAASRRLRTTYWIVGYDRAFEALVGEQFTTLPDVIVFDPYPNQPTETLTSTATEDVTWIRDQEWYDGQEVGIGEFGMPVSAGDEAMARYYTDLRRQLADLGVSWAVLFNRERDFDTRIAGRTDGQRFPDAQAAFAASLAATSDC